MEQIALARTTWFSKEVLEILNQTVFLIPNWKWAVIAIALVLGFLLKPLLKFILKTIKTHNPLIKHYPEGFVSQIITQPIEQPLSWLLMLLLWSLVEDALDLPSKFDKYFGHTLKAFITLQLIALLYYAVDAMKDASMRLSQRSNNNFTTQLIPYAAKSAKTLIVILGVLIALQSFGLNVMSLLAGLGLGGLALALAAQDTAANLFGSITIMFDTPFKVGDLIKIRDIKGTVEEIGFRSTRIRTAYNSVIAIPNALVTKETVDNMGVRPARRISQVIGVTYDTSPHKIVEFCNAIRSTIQNHDKVLRDTVTVNFNKYSESSLDILVIFHLRVFSGSEELATQEIIFLEILKIADNLKIDFAYPTTTSYQRMIEPALNIN